MPQQRGAFVSGIPPPDCLSGEGEFNFVDAARLIDVQSERVSKLWASVLCHYLEEHTTPLLDEQDFCPSRNFAVYPIHTKSSHESRSNMPRGISMPVSVALPGTCHPSVEASHSVVRASFEEPFAADSSAALQLPLKISGLFIAASICLRSDWPRAALEFEPSMSRSPMRARLSPSS